MVWSCKDRCFHFCAVFDLHFGFVTAFSAWSWGCCPIWLELYDLYSEGGVEESTDICLVHY